MEKVLGQAKYKAYRLAGIVRLTATGETPNFNDKVDFEQLPFLIFPPMYAFYFIHSDVALPAIRPFKYDEDISFPKSATSIRIQDADGFHDVPIASVDFPDIMATSDTAIDNSFCVFRGIGINPYMTAPCAAHLPPGYERVFGPASIKDCREYIKKHGGVA